MNFQDKLISEATALQRAGKLAEAEAAYTQLLREHPRHAGALHAWGQLKRQQGMYDEAIRSIDTAAGLDENNAGLFFSLGKCYLETNQLVAAELCFEKALALDTANTDASNNLALALLRSGKQGRAMEILRKGLELRPDDENLLSNLANIHLRNKAWAQAAEIFRRVLATNPRSAAATFGLIASMIELHQAEEALVWLEGADLNASFLAERAYWRGLLLDILGHSNEACAAFDQGLAACPGHVRLLFSRAQASKMTTDDHFRSELLALAPYRNKTEGRARAQLCYALAKAHLDTGDYAQAAAYYAEGGAALRQTIPEDETADDRFVSRIIERMDEARLRALREQAGQTDKTPIFILGMPRSGTTLVEQIIASHSQVFAGGELPYLTQALEFRLTDGLDSPELSQQLFGAGYDYLGDLRRLPQAGEYRRITDKMPGNFMYLGLIAAMFPAATIVHCRRDPVDTCISCYTTLFAEGQAWSFDLAATGRMFRRYWRLMEHWRKVVPGRFVEIRYEQLVENPERQTRMLLDACGLDWEDRCLDFHNTRRAVTTASVQQVRQPIYTSSIGRWRAWQLYIQPLLDGIHELEVAYWAEIGIETMKLDLP